MIFITHRLDEIFAICDRMTVPARRPLHRHPDVKDVTKSEMIAMMIGRELKAVPERSAEIGDECLRVEHMSDGGRHVKDVSFSVRRGEVLGFAGLVGAGRTETMRLIFGATTRRRARSLSTAGRCPSPVRGRRWRTASALSPKPQGEEGLFPQPAGAQQSWRWPSTRSNPFTS